MNKKYIMINIFVSLFALMGLTACGFQPVYSTHSREDNGSVVANLSQVQIAIIPDHVGQVLRNDLIDRFYVSGYPADPQYQLSVLPLQEVRSDLDLTKDSETTRSQLRLSSQMVLKDMKGNILLERNLFAIASFNVLQSEFATRVTEDNARQNAVHDLARQIELNIGLYLQKK